MRKRTLKELRAFETANHAKKADRRPEEKLRVCKSKKKCVYLDMLPAGGLPGRGFRPLFPSLTTSSEGVPPNSISVAGVRDG